MFERFGDDCAGSHRAGKPGERGWAEVVVILAFAAFIGFAFLWALVLHEKPPNERDREVAVETTTDTLTPPTLPPPRKYPTEGGVNVRQGPAANTTVLTKLDGGARVTVQCRVEGQNITTSQGSTNQWLRVDLGSFGVGFVSALYVDVGDDIEDPTRIGTCI